MAGAAALGCGDDETSAPDVGPTGNPKVTITLPQNGDCVAIDDGTTSIPISFAVEQLLLRPPGACGAYAQCGHARLLAKGSTKPNNESAGPVIDLKLEDIADRYVEDLALRIEIIAASTGQTMLDHETAPVAAEISITTAKSCEHGGGGNGGTGGGGGGGAGGGSGGTGGSEGGAGGAGGTGGAGGSGGGGGQGGA